MARNSMTMSAGGRIAEHLSIGVLAGASLILRNFAELRFNRLIERGNGVANHLSGTFSYTGRCGFFATMD